MFVADVKCLQATWQTVHTYTYISRSKLLTHFSYPDLVI